MVKVTQPKKSCSINPLKSSAPLGAAMAYLGVEGAVPLFHGSQGCTAFAMVLAVRHFKEAIPLQTTAMNEASTVLGGADNLQEALLNINKRMKPRFIGIASTALVETRGEDFGGELRLIRQRCRDLDGTAIVFASTPDFEGALEEGWAKATSAIIDALVPADGEKVVSVRGDEPQLNVLPGVNLTPGDVEELRDLLESMGIRPIILPDISGSLDGHVPDEYVSTSLGGSRLEDIAIMGASRGTIAIGEHMRAPAEKLRERTGVPVHFVETATGLSGSDELVAAILAAVPEAKVPPRLERERSRLVDSMLDGHFWFGGRRVALAGDPDLLLGMGRLLAGLGAEIPVCVSTTRLSPSLSKLPVEEVIVGDLFDFEDRVEETGVDLLMTHSHGRMASERLETPLFRIGFPVFDRLGHAHRRTIGYRGTMELIFELANTFTEIAEAHHHEGPEAGAHGSESEESGGYYVSA